VNNIIYEGIASRRPYILLTVVILLLSTFSAKYGVVNSYGQQSTVNDTEEQVKSSLDAELERYLEGQDQRTVPATPEPSADASGTAVDDQSDTNKDDSNVKATDTQEKQDSADESTRSSITVDNDDSNKVSGTSQSDETKEDGDQNRGDGDQNRGDGDQNRGDGDQDSENENEDENDDENEDNDTPLEYRLPFP
jgi:hypothetical protein